VNVVYASLVTGGLLVISTILTLKLNHRHEERLRNLDYEHAHREGLQELRLAAYRQFDNVFSERRRAHRDLAVSWTQREIWAKKVKGAPPGSEGNAILNRFDAAEQSWVTALTTALELTEELEDAFAGVQLVATSAVAERAASLLEMTTKAWEIQRDYASSLGSGKMPGPDEWQRLQDAEATIETGLIALKAARSIELGIETVPNAVKTRSSTPP